MGHSVGIVAIARLENDYINEWVGYHRKLGFDHIYLYDNSFGEEIHIDSALKEEYCDFVTVVPAYGKEAYQKQAYEHAYAEFGGNHEFLLYIDIDEFFTLCRHNTISEYIDWLDTKCSGFQQVRVQWELYDDNNAVERDIKIPVHEFFTQPATGSYADNYNCQAKCIVRTGLDNTFFPTVHHMKFKTSELITLTSNGLWIAGEQNVGFMPRDVSVAKIRHYMTKTISEFMTQKLRRGDADGFIERDIENRFFFLCRKTPEKIDYYEKHRTSRMPATRNNGNAVRSPSGVEIDYARLRHLENQENNGYIDYWKDVYNLGDVFSNFLFNRIYNRRFLDRVENRKTIRFIGSEIPTPGWMNHNTLCCGMGWRVKDAQLNPSTVTPDNFCYVRGKISRQRVLDAGIAIPKDLPVGDSGLLASLLYKPRKERKYDIGIITHFEGAKNLENYMKLAKEKYPDKSIGFATMNDMRMDVTSLFEFISGCGVVLASSLHAIIFCHSFGVPVLFFSDVDSYKFRDYYSVYDRIKYDFSNGTKFNNALECAFDDEFLAKVNPTSEEVHTIQRNILNALPYKDCLTVLGWALVFGNRSRETLIMQNKDSDVLGSASSGGVVPAVMDFVWKLGGVCFGVVFDSDFTKLRYVEVNGANRKDVIGSKYIDVEPDESILERMKSVLSSGAMVLFVGRPCQCHLMRLRFRGFKNLILLELSCYGVAENAIWEKYIASMKKKYGDVESICFRDKRIGWNEYCFTMKFKDGTLISEPHLKNKYMKSYLNRKNRKERCRKCVFDRTFPSGADIQCGDAWGIGTLTSDNDRGRSIVIGYTKLGCYIIDSIRSSFVVNSITDDAVRHLTKFNNGLRV